MHRLLIDRLPEKMALPLAGLCRPRPLLVFFTNKLRAGGYEPTEQPTAVTLQDLVPLLLQ